MYSAKFPEVPATKACLWKLWRFDKHALKQDGFAINLYKKKWNVCWFHQLSQTDLEKIPSDINPAIPIPRYVKFFSALIAKWSLRFEEVNSPDFIQVKSDAEQADDIMENTWFVDDNE